MHPGSGPSDRSNDGLFEPLADHLLTHGIAIAWFDNRGVGGSGGALADAGIVEQAADLCAALDAVRSEIGSLPIDVFGHSQGGLVVVEAAQTVSPAFVISQSGPAVSPNTQEAFSTATRLRRAGWDEQRITRAVDQVRVALQRAVDGGPWDDQVKWYAERRDDVEELIEIGAFVAADPERWRLIARMGAYNPVDALRNVRVPLLAIFGAADQVVPVESSVRNLERAVDPALLELMIVTDANHLIDVRNLRPATTLNAIVEFILRATTAKTLTPPTSTVAPFAGSAAREQARPQRRVAQCGAVSSRIGCDRGRITRPATTPPAVWIPCLWRRCDPGPGVIEFLRVVRFRRCRRR